jgi:hypothetical protein
MSEIVPKVTTIEMSLGDLDTFWSDASLENNDTACKGAILGFESFCSGRNQTDAALRL